MARRRILLTNALPYANHHLHLGHLVGHVLTDVWRRFQLLRGHEVLCVCADDTHGTATMLRARQEGRSEEALIEEVNRAHQEDLLAFDVRYDHYSTTHSETNRALCAEVWAALRLAGMVHEREVEQLYDPVAGIFLADRFVKGTCPRCGAPDQHGDSCEKCGATYRASEVLEPVSTISGARPDVRRSPHLFVEIEQLHDFLAEWTQAPGRLQPEIARYLATNFLAQPLQDWDVSRPAPYFGFEIPDAPGHYWYVWFDAPLGYVATAKEWCAREGQDFDRWWRSDDVEVHHVIGKDITYFHTLFWPSMLRTAGLTLPHRIQVQGFLTVEGEKMSKSRGTFVLARTYRGHLDPAWLRYWLASKVGTGVDDLDFSGEEFAAKVNSDLVGKVVNLASRTARFVESTGLAPTWEDDEGLFAHGVQEGEVIAEAYEAYDLARAMRRVMALADRANAYVERKEPWRLKREAGREDELRQVSTLALNLFRQIAVYLAPVLPRMAEQVGELLGRPLDRWEEAARPLVGTPVGRFRPLLGRVDLVKVRAMFEASRPDPSPEAAGAGEEPEPPEPLVPTCSFEEFERVDLRVARVLEAEVVKGSDKLLRLRVDLGPYGEREVLAGVRQAYRPEVLVGRLVVVVANLAPRTMRFGTSEAMVLAGGPGGPRLHLLAPDAGAEPGQRVR